MRSVANDFAGADEDDVLGDVRRVIGATVLEPSTFTVPVRSPAAAADALTMPTSAAAAQKVNRLVTVAILRTKVRLRLTSRRLQPARTSARTKVRGSMGSITVRLHLAAPRYAYGFPRI